MDYGKYTANELFENWTESFSVYEIYVHEDGTEDLRLIAANRSFAKLIDADYDTLVGRLFTDACTRGLNWLPLYIQTAKENGTGNLQEAYNEDSQKYLSTFVFSPQIGQVAVLVVDRTTLWQNEQTLLASNNDITALVSAMSTGFCIGKLIRDKQGNAVDMRFEMANAAFDRLEGFPSGTLPGKRLFEVRKEVPHFCKYVEAVERRVKVMFTKPIATTGLILEAMCFSSYDDTLICIENDVTERVTAVKKNNDLAALVSTMTTGFSISKIIRDDQGNAVDMLFEMANAAFDTLEGFPSGTLPGKRLFEVRNEVPHFCKYVEAVESKEKVQFTKQIKATGRILDVICFSSEGDTFICIENDVTETVKAAEELQQTYTTIDLQNKTILSSIDYASKIQKNLLPNNNIFEKAFSDYSVFWNPRDIVGGDIYWIKNFEKGTVLCVCDCTGHGTPGALLTMLVASAFEDIVEEDTCNDTAQILYSLDQRLVSVFGVCSSRQADSEMSDIKNGCDLAVLFIARDGSVSISAGQTHVFICDGKEVKQIKGQRLYVGEGRITDKAMVQTVYIPANPDNKFYIASDGLYDQMGQASHLPFGYKRFMQLILQHHYETQTAISDKIWETFEYYRGEQPRRDDIELISFQI